jgi:DNA/RNA endonuclease YhcR with UshA esterase domain
MKRALLTGVFLMLCVTNALGQIKLNAQDAKNHIGENATVCGTVASTRFAQTTKGKPTFLNLEKPYPEQVFTVLIWGENRNKFGIPEATYQQKKICVTGTIQQYRGKPEIIVEEPSQITME